MKTVDITAKEWFDKVNGNSYFSARVTVDYGLPTEDWLYIPFQYGYGNHYLDIAKDALVSAELMPSFDGPLSLYLRENGIIMRHYKVENCLKRDAKAWGIDNAA